MTRTSPVIAITLAISLTASPNYSVASIAQGKTCEQIVNAFNARTQAFVRDADQRNHEFVRGEFIRAGVGAVNNAALTAFYEGLQKTQEALNNLYLCTASGPQCLKGWLNMVQDAGLNPVREWINGLTEEAGLSAVRDRVLEATNLIQDYMKQTLAITFDTMAAMQQCTTPMPGQPRVALDAVPPAEMIHEDGTPIVEEPPSKPVEAQNGGSGIGSTLGWLGAAGAGLYGAQALGLFGQSCGEAPNNYAATCENQGRNSSTCLALQNEYRAWCDSCGGRFSYTGGCVPGR